MTRPGGGASTAVASRLLATIGPAAAILALQLVAFPLPLGVWVRGAILGAATALIALGMALVYRANRIVNFAQGDLGVIPAVVVFLLLDQWGWPYAVSVGVGAACALLLGGVVELTIVRRFFDAPRLVLTVATIGLAQLLAGLAVMLPRWFGVQLISPRIPEPFDVTITVGDTILRANSVLALVVAPLAMVALIVFLRATRVGIAVRAAADRADRAALLGIPVKRLHTLVWAIAALLAFTAVFLRAGILGLPVGSMLSLGLLLRSLTALVLGRMTNLPAIGLSAIALGILELGVDWHAGSTLPILGIQAPPLDVILAVVIVVALLAQRRSAARGSLDDQSSWRAAAEVRPIPRELAHLPEVRWARAGLFALVGVAALVLPHLLSVDRSLKASAVLVYAILGLSIVVLTGWAGQVSLGQVAFFAVGAATGAWMTLHWRLDLTLVVLAAGCVGACASVVVGLPALRFRGLYLAVTTLAFALATSAYLLHRTYFAWVPTERVPRRALLGRVDITSATAMYYVVLGALVLALVALVGIRRSRTGRALTAMRDNERAAQTFGISALRAKLTAFALSGFLASVAGALFVHHQQAFGQSPYAPFENLAVFAMVVLGGVTSLAGAVLGALYLQGSGWFLPGDWQFLASGIGVLLVLLLLPGGLSGLLYAVRDQALRKVAARRGLVVPSLVADVRVEEPVPEPTPLPGAAAVANGEGVQEPEPAGSAR